LATREGGFLQRRTFIKASAATVLLAPSWGALARGQSNGQPAGGCGTAFVWQTMVPTPADAPALNGHTDTIPDIVGRLGSRIDLAIFTEGNHFPAPARNVYPRHGFATMDAEEFGEEIALG
jgi:hypothetical protein